MLIKKANLPQETYCVSPEHNPPTHIVLEDGVYEYTCPSCGKKVDFIVMRPIF